MKKNYRQVMGLLMIYLIVILPFYSASAIAGTLTISKNTGQAGIDGFVNAEDDVWTVEATVSNLQEGEEVAPEKVSIKIGNTVRNFNSCSAADSSVVCSYIEPLTGGIASNGYTFDVLYTPVTGTGDQKTGVIQADGAAPLISFAQGNAKQESAKVRLTFSVNDGASTPCVGLASINVFDADSGTVLFSKNDFPEKFCSEYAFIDDPLAAGFLPTALEGEGLRRLKITAVDRLGHSATSGVVSFLTDFVKPDLLTLNFTAFGKFVGATILHSPLVVTILEKGTLQPAGVVASVPGTDLNQRVADSCVRAKAVPEEWICTWKAVKIEPVAELAVTIRAIDASANVGEETLTESFVTDTQPPVVEYFGPLLEYDSVGYVKSGKNIIIAKIREQGAGIKQENVLANLGGLGGSSSALPAECIEEGELFVCTWQPTGSFPDGEENVRLNLVKVEDLVGNQAVLPERAVGVDLTLPVVEKIALFGITDGVSKNYLQSNDLLRLQATVTEATGLLWKVDVRDLLNDAETLFPTGRFNDAGWAVFRSEDICTRNTAGKWECTIETAAVKSGYVRNAFLTVQLQDTAGNAAHNWPEAENAEKRSAANDEGKYALELLALKEEENPDYWSTASVKPLLPFVDLDAMVFPTRLPLDLLLRSDNPEVRALNVEIVQCTPTEEGESAPGIGRTLLYGGASAEGVVEPRPTLLMEFSPVSDVRTFFSIGSENEFKGKDVSYTCQLKIYSKVGKTALKSAELQDVTVVVPFAFSSLGSIDENLKQKVTDLKESDFMKFATALGYINTALQWINYVLNILQIFSNVFGIIDLFSEAQATLGTGFNKAADGGAIPTVGISEALRGIGAALQGNCLVMSTGTHFGWKVLEYLNIITQILNCNPPDPADLQKGDDPKSSEWGLGWYGYWQRFVLESYNKVSGRDLLGIPAQTVYENIYLSGLSLCVPGLLYNVQKAQEVYCRRIICYAKEVPAGLATYDACEKLYDFQMCEFVYVPLLDLTPLAGIADLGAIIKSAYGSPLGVIKLAEIVVCSPLCFVESPGVYYACKTVTGLNKLINIVNSIVSSIDNRPDLQGSPYCDQVEDINVDELTGQVPA